MTTNEILKLAAAEIGVKEYPADSNNVKYNTWYYGKEVSGSSYPWCCVFISYLFKGTDLVKKTALCMDMGQWFKDNKQWYEGNPKAGDIIFFKFGTNNRWTNHVGIVESVNADGSVNTIEGNTSSTSDDNGGRVMRRVRTSYVGLGRPKYSSSIVQSTNYMYGIDVSSYQTITDFNLIKRAGISFAVLRGTVKNNTPDPKFKEYLKGFDNVGIDCSVYKYSYATTISQAQEEARSIINLLGNRKMKIWLDLENAEQCVTVGGKKGITRIVNAFISTCENEGFEVGIYANKTWFENYIEDTTHDHWCARYPKADTGVIVEELKPNIGEIAWQYSSKGKVPGINGNVDMDILYMHVPSKPSTGLLQKVTDLFVKNENANEKDMEGLYLITAHSLNIRSTPNSALENNKVGYYNQGDFVTVTAQTSDGKFFKDVKGRYFSASPSYSHQVIAEVTASTLNVRSTPDASKPNNIIDQLVFHSKVKCIDKRNEWFKIRTSDGCAGWCSGKYLNIS